MNSSSTPSADAAAAARGAEARQILARAAAAGLRLRLTGSLAVQLRCPAFGPLAQAGRSFHDIDFVAYKREGRALRELLAGVGYAEDREVAVVSEGGRAIFRHGESRTHVDVFFDRLDFCHVIPLEGRIEVDPDTLPLAELLLGKLQIVKINEKDLLDAMALLLEHDLGEDDRAIDSARIARLLAEDWGLWRTVTMNLAKLARFAEAHSALDGAARAGFLARTRALESRLEAEPKPLAWRLRAKLGDRVKWYKDVEEVG